MPNNSTVLMRNAVVRQFTGGGDDKDKLVITAAMSCDATKEVMEAFEFDDLPDSSDGPMPLLGKVLGSHFVLTPNGGIANMKAHEKEIDFDDLTQFKIVRVRSKTPGGGEKVNVELRFTVTTHEDGAETKLGSYKRQIGRGGGLMKISYSGVNKDEGTGVDDGSGQMTIGDAKAAAEEALTQTRRKD